MIPPKFGELPVPVAMPDDVKFLMVFPVIVLLPADAKIPIIKLPVETPVVERLAIRLFEIFTLVDADADAIPATRPLLELVMLLGKVALPIVVAEVT